MEREGKMRGREGEGIEGPPLTKIPGSSFRASYYLFE